MKLASRLVAALALTLAAALLPGCSSDGAGSGTSRADPSNPNSPAIGNWDDGEAVRGNVAVTWKNLNPQNPSSTQSLVNESSEIGQKLRSGKASSSETRVIGDAEMGRLLAALKKVGFFQYATDGLGLGNAPDVPGRRGIVVVTQDGRDKGLMLTTNLGPGPIPTTYRDAKQLVLAVHSQVQGFDVKARVLAPNDQTDERVFTAPAPRLKRP